MKKALALILALVMALALVACGGNNPTKPSESGKPSEPSTPVDPGKVDLEIPEGPTFPGRTPENKTLQVAYSPFNSKFSPFFSQTAYDQDACAMTQIGLLTSDRTGAIILNGIQGETINYNGTDYTYYGPANLKITENADGTVEYFFTLRNDITFSDGEPLTIDDVIFTMYVLADPAFDGNSTFYALPIKGMEEYRSGMGTMVKYLMDIAGEGKHDSSIVPDDVANAFWEKYHAATKALAQEIVDYCLENYADYGAKDVYTSAGLWGYDLEEGATVEDFAAALEDAYGSDIAGMISTESAGSSVEDLFPGLSDYMGTITYGDTAPNITGIEKLDDYHMRITLTEVDATAIYQLGTYITPLHYYGDKAQFDYANNKFGFPKGDVSMMHAKDTQPLGAGPYKFIKFENGVINYEANETYFLGCPYTKYVNFVETNSDDQKLNGVITGTIDITDPSFSNDTVGSIKENNSNGEVTGDKITTDTVDNLGYGYIGQNAINVSVGGDPASEQSKALRHAFATVFSVYRDVAIDSYYGDRAAVINYPISNTSWAAPRPADDGYQIAFSVDVDGKPLYTSDMTPDQKYAAALQGALGFFEKAGYTVENGKLTAAPAGAKLEYTFWIPGDGTGDHPAFMIVDEASRALASIGMTLNIKDLANSQDLWNNLDALQVEMWAAAWGSTVDPDMTQIYFADVANGPSTGDRKNPNGGPNQGGSNYEYCIADPDLIRTSRTPRPPLIRLTVRPSIRSAWTSSLTGLARSRSISVRTPSSSPPSVSTSTL